MLAVAADMVDGIAATNRLEGAAADALRDALWRTVTEVAAGFEQRVERPLAPVAGASVAEVAVAAGVGPVSTVAAPLAA